MKKQIVAGVFLLSTLVGGVDLQAKKPYSNRVIEEIAFQPFLSNKKVEHLETAEFDYVPGLVALSILRTWELYPHQKEYYDKVKAYADNCLGVADTLHTEKNNIDDLAAAKIFFILYREELRRGNASDAHRYKMCATHLKEKLQYQHARIPEGLPGAGGFWHKGQYVNQMWLDGLFMGPAFWAEWEAQFGDERSAPTRQAWADIAHQFKTIHQYTFDPTVGMNYHAWSADPTHPASFWAKQSGTFKGCSPEFWGRSMGWYFAALVDVLELMPMTHPDYKPLRNIVREVAAGLAKYQDKQNGCWYQLLRYDYSKCADGKGDEVGGKMYNVGSAPNYIESSATALITYGYYKGIRIGVLPDGRYRTIANNAYRGMLQNFIFDKSSGLQIIQTCASAGLGAANSPARTGSVNYYLCGPDVHITFNEGKVIGAFVLASMEKERRD